MLHQETVDPYTIQLLNELSENDELSGFSLVGGTALSLQLGHRVSTDLDIFSTQDFNSEKITEMLKKYSSVEYSSLGVNLVQGFINGIKIDFACHKYKILKKGIRLNNIHIASIE